MKEKARRITCKKQTTINAPADTVFPMLCPVLEEKWIPGWQYDLVYSDSGVNETNCIFTEGMIGQHFFGEALTTTWLTAIHDPVNKKIKFVILPGSEGIITVDVSLEDAPGNQCTVTWNMAFTVTGQKSGALSDDELRDRSLGVLEFIATLLGQYFDN